MADIKTVLLVEDSVSQAEAYRAYLATEPLKVDLVASGEAALEYLDSELPHVILLDLQLPGMHGTEVLNSVIARQLPTAVIVITDDNSVDVAVSAMRAGAFDFVTKPFGANRLRVTVRNALRQEELVDLVSTYREQYERDQFHDFIGSSLAMQSAYRIIESAAPSKASVFISGESGTGKELCAEAIHKESPRKDGPFVPVNCAAIPRELMESEIFGHVKGAFTGANKARDGAATQANGGTLFLDEICEMDLELQSKLLRFIQSGTFQPVGASQPKEVDVRFVSATNRDPFEEVKNGRFREDLYYRLHVIPLTLPPLRDRDEDVMLIGRWFLRQFSNEEGKTFSGFSADAEFLLRSHEWPGNVRELQNVIRQVVVLHPGGEVSASMLPPSIVQAKRLVDEGEYPDVDSSLDTGVLENTKAGMDLSSAFESIIPLWKVERDTIEKAIQLCDGNVPKAAALLGISASTIYRKKQAWASKEK